MTIVYGVDRNASSNSEIAGSDCSAASSVVDNARPSRSQNGPPRTFACVLALAALSASTLASAQDESPGRREFDEAVRQFEAENHQLALDGFLRAHEILVEEGNPNASLLWFNIARSQEELGRVRDALASFERYLAEASADAPYRGETADRVRELRARLAAQSAETPATASEATNARGNDTSTERAPGGGGFSPSPIGIAIAAIGAAAMIAGGVVGGLALAQDGDARSDCEGTRCTPEAYAALGDAQGLAGAADGLLWGGLAVLATGIVLTFVLGESPEHGDNRASVAAACDHNGCVVMARGEL